MIRNRVRAVRADALGDQIVFKVATLLA